jgi:hypothetical protein
MNMDAHRHWAEFFAHWPAGMARKGVLVTDFGEQVLFNGFLAGPDMLVVERQTPDTLGARKMIVRYASVSAVKIVEVIKPTIFQELGFRGTLAT